MVFLAGARSGGAKVAAMSGSISEYFSRPAQKRKPSSASSSDSSPVTEKTKQDRKRVFHEVSDSCEEE